MCGFKKKEGEEILGTLEGITLRRVGTLGGLASLGSR